MSPQALDLKDANLTEIFRRPYWDPVPPWLRLNDDLIHRFADLEIRFKIKELQIQQEKLEQFSEMIGKM